MAEIHMTDEEHTAYRRRMNELKTLRDGKNKMIPKLVHRPYVKSDNQLQFFNYDHLSEDLQEVSKPFHDLAANLAELVPDNNQRRVALQKLLEAKDAAVRARLTRDY